MHVLSEKARTINWQFVDTGLRLLIRLRFAFVMHPLRRYDEGKRVNIPLTMAVV